MAGLWLMCHKLVCLPTFLFVLFSWFQRRANYAQNTKHLYTSSSTSPHHPHRQEEFPEKLLYTFNFRKRPVFLQSIIIYYYLVSPTSTLYSFSVIVPCQQFTLWRYGSFMLQIHQSTHRATLNSVFVYKQPVNHCNIKGNRA